MKAAKILPDARLKARELEGKADELKVVAEDLKGAARLEPAFRINSSIRNNFRNSARIAE
jgi:hypothetical protein